MNSKQKRNLVIAYIVLFSFILWGVFFNDNEKKDNIVNSSLSNQQVKTLSNSLIIPSQGDMPMKEYLKMKELFEKDFIINFLDSFNELSHNDKQLIWKSFKEFYHNQIKIKNLFESDLSYKFIDKNISYKYNFKISNVNEYKIFLELISENKQQRVFKIDFSKKEKMFSLKTFSKDYLKVFIPYMNQKLYISIDKKIIVKEIYTLLENSAKQLELIKEKLRIKNRKKNV